MSTISPYTQALVSGNKGTYIEDPATLLVGWPGTTSTLCSRKSTFTTNTLGTTTKVYRNSDYGDIVILAQFYASYGATVDIEEGPTYTLTVTLPYDEIANLDSDPTIYALWEIVPNSIERSIFDIGIYSPDSIGGVIANERRIINNEIKAAVEYASRNPATTVNLIRNSAYASQQYLAQNYLALTRLKAENVLSFTQTLKRSLIIHNQSQLVADPIDTTGAPVVVAKDDLARLYSIPEYVKSRMLSSYGKWKSVKNQDSVELLALAGYLVKPPTQQYVTPNKIQITQEFVWDEWLDSHYRPYNNDATPFVVP